MNELVKRIKEAAKGCDTPGKKIRSKGKGRGLARGKGKGPRGTPAGEKTALDEAYEEGVKLALAEYLKMAGGAPALGVNPGKGSGFGDISGPGLDNVVQTQAVAGPKAARGPMGNMPGPVAMNMPAPKGGGGGGVGTPTPTTPAARSLVASR